jgi:hypothetical protein
MNTWLLRAVWVLLPVTAGDELAAALRTWSTAPRVTASVLLWLLWATVLVAVMVPRPVAMTAVRLGEPIALLTTVIAGFSSRPSAVSVAVAIAGTAVACLLGLRGEFPRACAQGAAYGDEDRFPLKVPPGIAFVVLPLAIVVVGAGIAVGPLLLADRQWIAGAIATLLGWPAAVVVARLAHQLSRRWIVLVPAGLVVADPLTLTDPVLFVRERIQGLGPADPAIRPPADSLDLRLGAGYGSCALLLHEEADIVRRVRGQGVGVRAGLLFVTPVAATRLITRAGARRIPVHRD